VKPSEFPEVAEHAHLRDFLSRHFDMQVEDVRSMLRLPIEEHGLNGGCNFAAVNILSSRCGMFGSVLLPKHRRSNDSRRPR
jgi:hypothetical protein